MAKKKAPAAEPEQQPAPRRQRQPRLRQQVIPGSEPDRIKALDDAAAIYHDAMLERVALSKEEDKAKDNLIEKMIEHGVARYETTEGLIVEVTEKKNVRVKRKKDEGDGEDDDDDGE